MENSIFDKIQDQPYDYSKVAVYNKILEASNGMHELYLGGLAINANITHILSLMSPDDFYQIQLPQGIIHKLIEIHDSPFVDLQSQFDPCIDFIEESRKIGNVAVHCVAGVSRSASIVVAYIMKTMKMNLENAFALVHSQRQQINPNHGFQQQLIEYEIKLKSEGIIQV